MVRVAAIPALLIAAISANAQKLPTHKAEPIFSVCDLRSDGGFARFHDENVTVTGELEATPNLTLLVSRSCDQAVQLVESKSLRAISSPTLTAFRRGIEAKIGCHEERPLHLVVKGGLDMADGAGDLLYTLTITDLLKVEFLTEDPSTVPCSSVLIKPHFAGSFLSRLTSRLVLSHMIGQAISFPASKASILSISLSGSKGCLRDTLSQNTSA